MQPRESSDQAPLTDRLAERVGGGDRSRFDELYARVAPALYAWSVLRIGAELRGRLEPEEIAQETWSRGLGAIQLFDPQKGTFRAWIFGLAKNVLMEALRAARRPDSSPGGWTSRGLENHPDSITSITQRIARDEALQHFLEQVRTLGREEQTLTILCGLEGMSCEEAAERLGISRDAALKRWQRLRREIVARDLPRELLVEESAA